MLTISGNSDYTGTNGTELASYTISVPVAPYLNTSLEYVLVAAVPYIAGVSLEAFARSWVSVFLS